MADNNLNDQIEMEMANVSETPTEETPEAEFIEVGDLKIPQGSLDDATLKELEQRIERSRTLEESNKELTARSERANGLQQKAELYDRLSELCETNPWLFDQIRQAQSGVAPEIPEDAFGEGVDGSALVRTIQQLMDRRLGSLESKLSQLDRMLLVTNEVGEMSQQDPDVRSLEPKIREVLARNPSLSVKDAYKIVSHDQLLEKVKDADRIRKNNLGTSNAMRKPSGADSRPTRVDTSKMTREQMIEHAFQQAEAKIKANSLGG